MTERKKAKPRPKPRAKTAKGSAKKGKVAKAGKKGAKKGQKKESGGKKDGKERKDSKEGGKDKKDEKDKNGSKEKDHKEAKDSKESPGKEHKEKSPEGDKEKSNKGHSPNDDGGHELPDLPDLPALDWRLPSLPSFAKKAVHELYGMEEQEEEELPRLHSSLRCTRCHSTHTIRLQLRDCGHAVCIACLLLHLRYWIEDKEKARIKCPKASCPVRIHENDIAAVLDEREDALSNYMSLPHRQWLAYQHAKHSIYYAFGGPEFVKHCPTCKSPYTLEPGCHLVRCSNARCSVRWCWVCGKHAKDILHYAGKDCSVGADDVHRAFYLLHFLLSAHCCLLCFLAPAVYVMVPLVLALSPILTLPYAVCSSIYERATRHTARLLPEEKILVAFKCITALLLLVPVSFFLSLGSFLSICPVWTAMTTFLIARSIPPITTLISLIQWLLSCFGCCGLNRIGTIFKDTNDALILDEGEALGAQEGLEASEELPAGVEAIPRKAGEGGEDLSMTKSTSKKKKMVVEPVVVGATPVAQSPASAPMAFSPAPPPLAAPAPVPPVAAPAPVPMAFSPAPAMSPAPVMAAPAQAKPTPPAAAPAPAPPGVKPTPAPLPMAFSPAPPGAKPAPAPMAFSPAAPVHMAMSPAPVMAATAPAKPAPPGMSPAAHALPPVQPRPPPIAQSPAPPVRPAQSPIPPLSPVAPPAPQRQPAPSPLVRASPGPIPPVGPTPPLNPLAPRMAGRGSPLPFCDLSEYEDSLLFRIVSNQPAVLLAKYAIETMSPRDA